MPHAGNLLHHLRTLLHQPRKNHHIDDQEHQQRQNKEYKHRSIYLHGRNFFPDNNNIQRQTKKRSRYYDQTSLQRLLIITSSAAKHKDLWAAHEKWQEEACSRKAKKIPLSLSGALQVCLQAVTLSFCHYHSFLTLLCKSPTIVSDCKRKRLDPHTHTHTKEKWKNLNCRKSDNSVASAREESSHWWSRAATTERRD